MIGLADASEILKALGDPSRVRLLSLLERDELTVAELVRITRLGQSRVSTHLARLKAHGLVFDRPDGASTYYRSAGSRMPEAARGIWDPLRRAAKDALLDEDRRRLDTLVRARTEGDNWADGTWADSVAGRMERHYSPGRTWEATLRGLLGLVRLGDVLDIASGDCAIAELLAPRARRITCLDRSARVLRAGRERLAAAGHDHIDFARADMHELPFPDRTFDEVLLLACLCYASDPDAALREAARVLRPGGTLIGVALHAHAHVDVVSGFGHLQPGFTPEHLARSCAAAGLQVDACSITARERRSPHFETITFHASK